MLRINSELAKQLKDQAKNKQTNKKKQMLYPGNVVLHLFGLNLGIWLCLISVLLLGQVL